MEVMGDGNEDSNNERCVKMLLKVARSKIEGESPDEALAALLHAVRITQGEEAIFGILDAAKKRAEDEAENEDDSLEQARRMSGMLLRDTNTMLYERGEQTILKDAFEDGSSVVCSVCSSLVPRVRYKQHQLYWCENVTGGGSSDDEMRE